MFSFSGRFQSHLFNFVSNQTRKFVDKTGTVLRHLKVTTIWGTQILLYPIYALFQSTRLAGRQIGQTVQKAFLQLTQGVEPDRISQLLAVDAPIQRVLAAIQPGAAEPENQEAIQVSILQKLWAIVPFKLQTLSSKIQTPPPSPLPLLPCSIQGIASLTPAGKLVLVAADNQIVDILTIEQQDQLRQRIIWEMANYWHNWRQRQLASQPNREAPRLPPIADRPTFFPPVRVFRQLMVWVQSGPVAIAANLFQESAIVPQPADLDWFSPEVSLMKFNPTHLIPHKIPTVSDFETLRRQLLTLSEVEALIRAAIQYFFGSQGTQLELPHLKTSTEPWLVPSDVFGVSGSAKPRAIRVTHKGSLRSQIQNRSTDFGVSAQSNEAHEHPKSKIQNPPRVSVPIENPLPPITYSAQTETAPDDTIILALPPQQPVYLSNLLHWVDRYLNPKQKFRSSSNLVQRKPNSQHLTRTERPGAVDHPLGELQSNRPANSYDRSRAKPTEPDPAIQKHQAVNPSSPTFTPGWIETKATPVGYVKHPLERILGWFDRGMAAIEKTLLAFWNWLTGR